VQAIFPQKRLLDRAMRIASYTGIVSIATITSIVSSTTAEATFDGFVASYNMLAEKRNAKKTQYLDGLTWNVLNQTKILSAALFAWLIMDRQQTNQQLFALCILFASAVLLVLEGNDNNNAPKTALFWNGAIPLLGASLISGLTSILSEIALKTRANMFVYSLELSVYSLILLLFTSSYSIQSDNFFQGWSYLSLLPVLTNSLGGIIVGAVTKFAGSVRKGFALIAGLTLTAFLQAIIDDKNSITKYHMTAAILVMLGIYLHIQGGHHHVSTTKKQN
jgi:UDP-sugar transporter A1/2/3